MLVYMIRCSRDMPFIGDYLQDPKQYHLWPSNLLTTHALAGLLSLSIIASMKNSPAL